MAEKTTLPKEAALSEVLNNNMEAVEQIKTSAYELEMVHAVLSTTVPMEGAEDDLQAAVERTSEIEQQLSETADALHQSNELLRELDANHPAGGAAKAKSAAQPHHSGV